MGSASIRSSGGGNALGTSPVGLACRHNVEGAASSLKMKISCNICFMLKCAASRLIEAAEEFGKIDA